MGCWVLLAGVWRKVGNRVGHWRSYPFQCHMYSLQECQSDLPDGAHPSPPASLKILLLSICQSLLSLGKNCSHHCLSMAGVLPPSDTEAIPSLVSTSTALITGLAGGQSFATCPFCPHRKQSPFFINSSRQRAQARSMSMGTGPTVGGNRSEQLLAWLLQH
jgi:hypothetical protein